ncbi:MAG TPA: MauE/DoxX family redox-associated membrane protein [Acidimicrobiales bacterium]
MTAAVLTGPLVAAAILLAMAGGIKLFNPSPLARSLRLAGLPAGLARPSPVRVAAAAEMLLGIATVLGGGRALGGGLAAATLAAYLAFAAFLVAARRRGGPLTSCGCFGRTDTPVTRAHITLDAAAAIVSGGGFTARAPGLPAALASHPGAAPALLAAVAALVAVAYVAFAVAPAAARP